MADDNTDLDQPFQVAAAADPRTVMPIDRSNPAAHVQQLLGKTYGNGQCVGIVQDPALGGAVGHTSGWSPMPVGADTQMGAPLAIFGADGKYHNESGTSHAVRMMRRFDDGSFLALEQYVDKNGNQVPAKLTLIPNTGKGGEYDASSYSVINDKGGASKSADDELINQYNQVHAPTMAPAAANAVAANPKDEELLKQYNQIHGGPPPVSTVSDPEGGPTSTTNVTSNPNAAQYLLGQAKLGLGQFVSNLPNVQRTQEQTDALKASMPPSLVAKLEQSNPGYFNGYKAPTNTDVYGSENVVAPPYTRYPGALIRSVTSNPAVAAFAPGATIGSALGGQVGADVAPTVGLSEETGRNIGSIGGGLAGLRYGSASLPKSGVQMSAPVTPPPVIPDPSVTKAALDTVLKKSIPGGENANLVRTANGAINNIADLGLKKSATLVKDTIEGMASNKPGQFIGVRNVINDQIAKLQGSNSSNASAAIDELNKVKTAVESVIEKHNPGAVSALNAHDEALLNSLKPTPSAPPPQPGLGTKAWNLAKMATPIIADHYLAGGSGLGLAYSVLRKIGKNLP